MTRTEINELFSHNISAARIGAALARVTALGLASCTKEESTGGRRPERWFAISKTEKEEVTQKWTM
jgi:DNA-binding PadR family transcriptional regulator